jgi:hypothetical protein
MLTVDPHLVHAYRKQRRETPTLSAKTALDWARSIQRARDLPGPDETWEQDGFEISCETVPDELTGMSDLDYLGTLSDDWDTGAIKIEGGRQRYCSGGRYQFFHPQPGCTEADHYQSLRESKYGKTQARELAHSYVRRDLDLLLSVDQSWWVVGVVVKVSRAGVELGCASTWGCDIGIGDDTYLKTDVIPDLVDEALDEAKATLASLCTHDLVTV